MLNTTLCHLVYCEIAYYFLLWILGLFAGLQERNCCPAIIVNSGS